MTDVSTTTPGVQRQIERAAMVRTLMGGTKAMRSAGERYLPRFASETSTAYNARVARSVLFNATRKTTNDMIGRVFQKPIQLGADVSPEIVKMAEDIDCTGRHLNIFARDVFRDAMQTGIGFIFVDMQKAVTRKDGLTPTLADEQKAGLRPYMVYIPIEHLIGWKSDTIGGEEVLTQLRLREYVTVPDGDFAERTIEQVRVLEPGTWAVWRKADRSDTWELHDEGTTSITSRIPLVPVYLNRAGFMCAEPPLEDLAFLNCAHWQSSSDQRNILTVARCPILFGTGIPDETTLEIGASSMIRTTDPNAKLGYVEHTGAAIGAGERDLQALEFQMQQFGLQLLVPQVGQTATGEQRDNAKEVSTLAAMALGLQDAIEAALGLMAEYLGLGADAGGSIVVNTDFGVALATLSVADLINMRNANLISMDAFWSELKRRGVLADSFDPDTEKDRLASEAPQLDAGPGRGMTL